MILALDDDVPDVGVRGDPRPTRPSATCGRSASGARRAERRAGAARSRTGSTPRSSSSGTASPTLIAEGRFQGQAESPLSPIGRRQAALVGSAAGRTRTTPRPCRCPPASRVELVHSPLAPDDRDGRGHRRRASRRERLARHASGPTPASSRSARAPGRACIGDEIRERYGARRCRPGDAAPLEAWAPGGESLPEVAGTGPTGARRPARRASADGRRAGHARPSQVAGYRRSTARPPVVDRGRPRRRLQDRAADAVRPAARALLDVVDGPVRRSPSSSSGPGGRSCAPTT